MFVSETVSISISYPMANAYKVAAELQINGGGMMSIVYALGIQYAISLGQPGRVTGVGYSRVTHIRGTTWLVP